MKRLPLKPLTLMLTLGLGLTTASLALASGTTKISQDLRAEITAKLTADGYDVRKIEPEDGMIEVYALKDGQRFELYLDKDLNVTRVKQDD